MERRWIGLGDAVLAAALLVTAGTCAAGQRWGHAAAALLLALTWGAVAVRRLRPPRQGLVDVALAAGPTGPPAPPNRTNA